MGTIRRDKDFHPIREMRVVTSFALVLCLCFVWGTFAGVEAETVPIGTPELVASLEVLNNFCNDFSKEKFLCHVVFSEFCTYCRKDSGNKCVTKHQVTEYEKGAPFSHIHHVYRSLDALLC